MDYHFELMVGSLGTRPFHIFVDWRLGVRPVPLFSIYLYASACSLGFSPFSCLMQVPPTAEETGHCDVVEVQEIGDTNVVVFRQGRIKICDQNQLWKFIW